jgi:integrase
MAKVSFLYRGTKEVGKLSIRFISGKEIDCRVSTPISSRKEYWFKRTTKKGKTTNSHLSLNRLGTVGEVSNHKSYLLKVEKDLINKFLEDSNAGVPITSEWLKLSISSITKILDTKEDIDKVSDELQKAKDLELEQINSIIHKNLLSTSIEEMFTKYATNFGELKKFKVTYNRLIEFQTAKRKQFAIKDLNQTFVDSFMNWAVLDMKYSKSYINAIIKRFKRSAMYSYENDENDIVVISKKISSIKGFKNPYKNKTVNILNYDELDKIDNTVITDLGLYDAKKSILLGCETGLRYSDLNKLIDQNIKNVKGINYWTFRTEKTDKVVQITITDRILYLINKYGLPQTNYPNDNVKLNEDVKKVCSKAGLNETIITQIATVIKVKDKNVTRNIERQVSKFEAITTRTFRRSFATNYYGKIDTSLIMAITGHTTEIQLKAYISNSDVTNIKRTKDQIDAFHTSRKEEKNNVKLIPLPKVSNQN